MMGTIAAIGGFFSAVMLVISILPIILFFKVWRMTNDVRKIERHLLAPAPGNDLLKEIHKKNPQVESMLFDAVHAEMRRVYLTRSGDYGRIVAKYRPLYAKAGLEMPDVFESIRTGEEWHDAFERSE
ncbi:MAG: hypothetical protein K2L06_00020 [Alistipes sp.]|nr:hypothetical protein [Alistipes sp.]